jgi:hypothetical protein
MNLEPYAAEIEHLYETSNHGTRKEDIEAAFIAGFNACKLVVQAKIKKYLDAAARRKP